MPGTVVAKRRMDRGMAILRILTGLLMVCHGLEVFSPSKMELYNDWESIQRLPLAYVWVYAGKGAELITGLMLALGWFTKTVSLVMAGLMFFICFYIGQGRFWYEDQHSFLFALMAMVFAVYGPGAWAIDNLVKRNQ